MRYSPLQVLLLVGVFALQSVLRFNESIPSSVSIAVAVFGILLLIVPGFHIMKRFVGFNDLSIKVNDDGSAIRGEIPIEHDKEFDDSRFVVRIYNENRYESVKDIRAEIVGISPVPSVFIPLPFQLKCNNVSLNPRCTAMVEAASCIVRNKEDVEFGKGSIVGLSLVLCAVDGKSYQIPLSSSSIKQLQYTLTIAVSGMDDGGEERKFNVGLGDNGDFFMRCVPVIRYSMVWY
jgi:hypothetical protein